VTAAIGDIPVVILCGGKGTRLREETEFRPKPLVEIGGRPILWHIMKHFAKYGARRFILCLGYKGALIKDWFLRFDERARDVTVTLGSRRAVTVHSTLHAEESHEAEGWEVTLADTGEETLTGARVHRAVSRYAPGERFFLTYGDGVSDVDLLALRAQHARLGTAITVTGVHPPARFGELLCEGDLVREFSEKPQTRESRINGGFFLCEPRFLSYVSDEERCTLEREPLERAARDGALGVYRHDGFWQCMDTLRDHQYLDALWRAGNAPWKTW
jgi:glucose-1-phosphate cytidylyltransferase